MIVLPENWSEYWHRGNPFDFVFSLRGDIYRNKDGRKTIRFELDGKWYFAKLHDGIGWKGLLKSLLRFKKPVFGAANEWQAIRKLEEIGQPTMKLVGYGQEGKNPITARSFIITEELTDTISLEDLCRNWSTHPPDVHLKRVLIDKVANATRKMHHGGLIHKDLYICHFLLDKSAGQTGSGPTDAPLYLIDLHRVVIQRRISNRWRIKDIAALHFSSMDIGLTLRDRLRFIRGYRSTTTLRKTLSKEGLFWRRIQKRGLAFYQEFQRKNPEPVTRADGSKISQTPS
jgi:heptose I phosphotransferase